MRAIKTLLISLGTVILALVAWAVFSLVSFLTHGIWHSHSFRYRETVIVQTPEGIKTGSSVREIYKHYYNFGGGWQYDYESKGAREPVVVDLGKRGILFAVYDHFTFAHIEGGPIGLKETLDQASYPVLVYFKDLNDPKTLEILYDIDACHDNERNDAGSCQYDHPHVKEDHTEEIFGKGVRLKQVTIELTNDPVTTGIEKYLPWFQGTPMSAGSPPPTPTPPKNKFQEFQQRLQELQMRTYRRNVPTSPTIVPADAPSKNP